jgi:mannose-6-phosphate isomerase-like protein (cupin superfamily)
MITVKNYQHATVTNPFEPGRSTLHDRLALTGAEVSINTLPAGVAIPFVHAHQQNEEVYVILNGSGLFFVDGDEFEVQTGSVLRIDPAGARSAKASATTAMTYVCIQTKVGSLVQHTEKDGVPAAGSPSWV